MDLINSYAIVAYVAGPVARFAERLRNELSPGCPHRAHITVLAPRPLNSPLSEAIEFARQRIAQFEPFDVRLNGIRNFSETQVIYLALAEGGSEFRAMHDVLNSGVLHQQDAYNYTPHITLGQQLPEGTFDYSMRLSSQRWRQFGPPPVLHIDTLTLVQQQVDGSWKDLEEFALGHVAAVGKT